MVGEWEMISRTVLSFLNLPFGPNLFTWKHGNNKGPRLGPAILFFVGSFGIFYMAYIERYCPLLEGLSSFGLEHLSKQFKNSYIVI